MTFSMPTFGEGAFAIVERDSAEEALEVLRKYASAAELLVCNIDFNEVRLINGGF